MSEIPSQTRIYQALAGGLLAELTLGRDGVGSRLRTECALSASNAVSRPTVHKTVLAPDVPRPVEASVGSGGIGDIPRFDGFEFELSEARLLFVGEAEAARSTQ